MLPSKLRDECSGGYIWKYGIGARIDWRHKGVGRDGVVDGRVNGESEEPVCAVAKVGMDGGGISVELEVNFGN